MSEKIQKQQRPQTLTQNNEPNRFNGALSCPHPGINMGPWNIGMHTLTNENNSTIVDGKYNLICYHYHEFRMLNNNNDYFPTGWAHTDLDRQLVYEPYFKLMQMSDRGQL